MVSASVMKSMTSLFILVCFKLELLATAAVYFNETGDSASFMDPQMKYTEQMTFSIRPGWFDALNDVEDIPSKFIKIKQSAMLGDLVSSRKICRKSGKGNDRHIPDNTLNYLAQCPWRFVENSDPNRIPQTILETECLCKNPVNAKKKDSLICQSIIEYISVYRKVDNKDGVDVFKRSWEPRSVACVASSIPKAKRKYILDTMKMSL